MPRRHDDDRDLPRPPVPGITGVHLVLASLGAGLVCGIVVVCGWLAFRHPAESQERMLAREQAQEYRGALDKLQKDGGQTLGDEILEFGRKANEEARTRGEK